MYSTVAGLSYTLRNRIFDLIKVQSRSIQLVDVLFIYILVLVASYSRSSLSRILGSFNHGLWTDNEKVTDVVNAVYCRLLVTLANEASALEAYVRTAVRVNRYN